MHYAAWEGNSEVVNQLVAVKSLDLDIQVDDKRTALYMASQKGHTVIMDLLLDAGANVNVVNQDGRVPLHMAVLAGNVEGVNRLLQAGAPVDAATKHGFTPLMLASFNGHTKIVECLLGAKADVTIKDKGGLSAFHGAVYSGNVEIVNLLLPDILNSTPSPPPVVMPVPFNDKLEQHFQLCISALYAYPANYYFHYILGNLYFQAGHRQMAIEAYDKSLRLNPQNYENSRWNVLQNIVCDECGIDPIRGPRYRCIICDDFDLCQQCFRAIPTRHTQHSFLEIPSKCWKGSIEAV